MGLRPALLKARDLSSDLLPCFTREWINTGKWIIWLKKPSSYTRAGEEAWRELERRERLLEVKSLDWEGLEVERAQTVG